MKQGRIASTIRTHLQRQQGASLLEGIAYLGIAAIVVLGAVALLGGAFASANTNRAYEEVTAIRTGVKKLYMSQAAQYGTVDMNAQLITARVFPGTLAQVTPNVFNAWNGAVNVVGATAEFTISYANVPQDVCISMVSSSSNAWVNVNINAGAVVVPPITPAVATARCNSANANTIVWRAN